MTERPIFIVGCPRSGTTMLQLMLHAHHRIAIPPETRFLLTAYRQRRAFGDLSRPENRRLLADWIVARAETRFADLGLDADRVAREITEGPGTLGSVLGTIFRGYAARFGKPRWGDKRPAYLQNVDLILRLFPTAQIVNVVRDGRACVASLKEMPWHRQGLHGTVAAWARAVDDARRASRLLDRSQWHELRYEDLVADPPATLAELCRFLGEDYDPAMTRPSELADLAVPKSKTWHLRTRSPVTTQRIGSWQQRLTREEIALCEAALGSRLKECGYELSGVARPHPAHILRYSLSVAPHRLAPAKRRLEQVTARIRPEPSLAHVPVSEPAISS
jgi:hypothetical protein